MSGETAITTKTYYVTEYALTEGIWEIKPGRAYLADDGRYLYLGEPGFSPIQIPITDFFTRLEDARTRVEQLADAKVASLKKQLERYEEYNAPLTVWKRER